MPSGFVRARLPLHFDLRRNSAFTGGPLQFTACFVDGLGLKTTSKRPDDDSFVEHVWRAEGSHRGGKDFH